MKSNRTTKTRGDIAAAVALKHSLKASDAKLITNTVFEAITFFLEQGHDVSIRRLANLRHVVRKEKVGQNISRGLSLVIPAKNTIKFMIADELEKKLNK